MVEESKKYGTILQALNATFITLIPKKESVQSMDKFRPIAMCNVAYQLISKVATNHLQPLRDKILSKGQGRYVGGKQILDGIIIDHETIHTMKYNKPLGMIIKLDMSKVFDKLNWSYFMHMLEAFGFCNE